MTEAIRHRRPTEADADTLGQVECWWIWRREWRRHHWNGLTAQNSDIPWRPIDQTPPPQPEPRKPKRRRFKNHVGGGFASEVESLEILPGDPPDLDAFIEQAVRIFELTNPLIELDERELGIARMRFDKARHGEGGDA